MKIFVTTITTLAILYTQNGFAQHDSSSSNHSDSVVTIVVENLIPHENAFDIMPSGSAKVYHLENAARMSLSKMSALNASLESQSAVRLRVKGTDVTDIIVP